MCLRFKATVPKSVAESIQPIFACKGPEIHAIVTCNQRLERAGERCTEHGAQAQAALAADDMRAVGQFVYLEPRWEDAVCSLKYADQLSNITTDPRAQLSSKQLDPDYQLGRQSGMWTFEGLLRCTCHASSRTF